MLPFFSSFTSGSVLNGDDAVPTERPRLGLMGFGAFGQLAARHLRHRFRVLASDPALPAEGVIDGTELVPLTEAASCPVVVLAVPVERLAEALSAIRPHLRPGALVVDVGSVKQGPAALLDSLLPPGVVAIGTHPLFGPQSARNGIAGLKIAVCPIRGEAPARRLAAFLRRCLGLRVFLVSPEEHDQEAAVVQGLTHLIAQALIRMEPLPQRLSTRSFELLMEAVEMVRYDAPAVFRAIERDNPHAPAVRQRFLALLAVSGQEAEAQAPTAGSFAVVADDRDSARAAIRLAMTQSVVPPQPA